MRSYTLKRDTKETKIELSLDLDGTGEYKIQTGVGFLNHMLELFAAHSGYDIDIKCRGDVEVDCHHTTEDIGIALGTAFRSALGDKRGIARYADRIIPMDEVVCQGAVDIGGRAFLNFDSPIDGKCGEFDMELIEEFMRAFAFNAGINVYLSLIKRGNRHHEAEAMFKCLARCLRDATQIVSDKIPSSKGVL